MSASIAGINLQNEQEQYLPDLLDWSPEVVQMMASEDGLILTDDHWVVIEFLRKYHEQYEIAPAIRLVTKEMGRRLGIEKGNTRYLFELFPLGLARQACRYAGLPKPTGCI